jgi:ribosomal protein L40E
MSHDLVCWRCGASLAALTLPLRRLEECPGCRAELHVCRMCVGWDPRVAKQCREEGPEEVRAKDQANFCDYFRPRSGAFDSVAAQAERAARDQLAALFGGGGAEAAAGSASAADDLFAPRPKKQP